MSWSPSPGAGSSAGPPQGRGVWTRARIGPQPWKKSAWQDDGWSTWVTAQKPLTGATARSVLAGRVCLSTPPLAWLGLLARAARATLPELPNRWASAQGPRGASAQTQALRSSPSSVPVPDPPRGQPYFPLLLRLFPLLRGGDRALRAWVRFLGLPGPLRVKLLWGSSRLSLKKNHTLGCEPGRWRGRGEGTHEAPTPLGATHASAGLPQRTY